MSDRHPSEDQRINIVKVTRDQRRRALSLTDALLEEPDAAACELIDLRDKNGRFAQALYRIAWEPFGRPEASAQEVLDAIISLARKELDE